MLERFYRALRAANIDARLATLHSGVCDAPYCVIYEGQDETTGKTTAVRHVLIDVLVPAAKPAQMAVEAGRICAALAAIGHRNHTDGALIALEDYKAVCRTLDFPVLCAR